ncbi:hypothetical protein ACLOJK_036321 [Asimina triloba]
MLRKELITLEDLNVIWEDYSVPSSIVLSAPTTHETPRDNRPGLLCLNEHMLGAGVRIPFDFGVAEAFWAFNVPPTCIIPHSWKVIQMMAWYCERRGCSANRYLWRELLICRSSQDYIEFLAWRDVKGIDNSPDSVPGWESRFFFARLMSEVDIWGVPNLPASQRWALMYFRGTTLRWHSSREEFFHWCESVRFTMAKERERRAPKRVRPSKGEGNLLESDSSAEEAPGSSSSGQLTPTMELEGTAPPLVMAHLKDDLEVSRAEVAPLQLMLLGDAV